MTDLPEIPVRPSLQKKKQEEIKELESSVNIEDKKGIL